MRNVVKKIIVTRLLVKYGLPFFGICLVLMLGLVTLLGITGAGFQFLEQQKVLASGSGTCVSTVVTKSDGSKETVSDPIPEEYREDIKKASEVSGMPYETIGKQLKQESNFDPRAQSPVGAQGVAQFMPATWAMYGEGGDPFNPHDAIAAYGRYMKALRAEVKQ